MKIFILAALFFARLGWTEDKTTILFLGDSITAGYGVKREESYPQRLAELLRKSGRSIEVINGAESGSLSSSVDSRLKFYLKRFKPDVVLIASGGNDARQFTPVREIEKNLQSAIATAASAKVKVALVQMQIFPNLGKEYADAFKAIYPSLVKGNKISLIPFFLTHVAGVPALNQADGFHPNADGHQKIAEFLKPHLEKLL